MAGWRGRESSRSASTTLLLSTIRAREPSRGAHADLPLDLAVVAVREVRLTGVVRIVVETVEGLGRGARVHVEQAAAGAPHHVERFGVARHLGVLGQDGGRGRQDEGAERSRCDTGATGEVAFPLGYAESSGSVSFMEDCSNPPLEGRYVTMQRTNYEIVASKGYLRALVVAEVDVVFYQ